MRRAGDAAVGLTVGDERVCKEKRSVDKAIRFMICEPATLTAFVQSPRGQRGKRVCDGVTHDDAEGAHCLVRLGCGVIENNNRIDDMTPRELPDGRPDTFVGAFGKDNSTNASRGVGVHISQKGHADGLRCRKAFATAG